MACWRCGGPGEVEEAQNSLVVTVVDGNTMTVALAHKPWCSELGGCSHCGGNPCRDWCLRVALPEKVKVRLIPVRKPERARVGPAEIERIRTELRVRFGSLRGAAAAYSERYGVKPASAEQLLYRLPRKERVGLYTYDQLETLLAS